MKLDNTFDHSTAQIFIDMLDGLDPDTIPNWGKMNSAEMLKHCRKGLEVPLGRLELRPPWWVKVFFSRVFRKAVTSQKPFRHGEKTAREFHTHDKSLDFETEKEIFVRTLQDFAALSDKDLSTRPHPIVGDFSADEWRFSQKKHIMHHWEQFGLL